MAFGEPQEVLKVIGGEIDRWTLTLTSNPRRTIYITLDSPEMPQLAHVIVSDPGANLADPIGSFSMRTVDEVRSVIKRIQDQWKNIGGDAVAPNAATATPAGADSKPPAAKPR